MRKLKQVGLVLLFMIILTGGSGCMKSISGKPNRGEIVQKLLKEKYQEDFKVYGSGEGYGSLTGNTFMVVASPVKNQDLKFEATVEKDGAYIIDEYIQALLEDEIKTIMDKEMGAIANDYLIKAYVAYAETTVKKDSISIEQYSKENSGDPIVIDLLINEDKLTNVTPEQEYAILSELFSKGLPINAALDIYYTNGDTIRNCEKYLNENAETDDEYYEILSGSREVLIGVSNGQFKVSLSEFVKKRTEE